jgi:hypothetical protein
MSHVIDLMCDQSERHEPALWRVSLEIFRKLGAASLQQVHPLQVSRDWALAQVEKDN